MNKKELFTELSIKFAVLEAKVDKLLELAMKPKVINPKDSERGPELFRKNRSDKKEVAAEVLLESFAVDHLDLSFDAVALQTDNKVPTIHVDFHENINYEDSYK